MYARGNGTQIVPAAWVAESTAPSAADGWLWRYYADWRAGDGYYQSLWWGQRRADGGYDFMAQGHRGHWIFVSPHEKLIIVRFGLDDGGVDSWAEVFRPVGEQLN